MNSLGGLVNGLFYMMYTLFTAIVMHWSNAIMAIILMLLMYAFADYFSYSLLKLKTLDNVQKSPVMTEFNAAITGLIPIRVYG